ncbi:DoxX family protein [Robertmurraya korlensis]|uniref:DoxX family protein n=1 Tax=Robertmurraya korlensis TaxID=519977 RepID=UPI00203B195E|nr:DoxX family protein [Robertmurraya korlensis]
MFIVMQVILAVFILVGGFIKLLRIPFQVEHWQHYQYPLWFMSVIGLIEVMVAIGILSGIWNRYLAVGSSVLLLLLMVGAVHAHMYRAHQSIVMILPAIICLISSIILIIKNLT